MFVICACTYDIILNSRFRFFSERWLALNGHQQQLSTFSIYLWSFSKLHTHTNTETERYLYKMWTVGVEFSLSLCLLFCFGFVWSTLHVMFAQARKTPARQKQRRKKSKTEKSLRLRGKGNGVCGEQRLTQPPPLVAHLHNDVACWGLESLTKYKGQWTRPPPLKLDRHIIPASIDLCFYSI